MKDRNKERRIRVCMVTGNYFPEISGGTLQCRTLINALKGGIDFSVIATTNDHSLDKSAGLVHEDIIEGVKIYRVAVLKDKTPFKMNTFLQLIALFLKHRRNFDILHMHGFTNKGMLFILLSKLFRKKILVKITLMRIDDPSSIRKSAPLGWLKYMLYSLCDLVVSPAPYLTGSAHKAGVARNRLVEIPNGVDTSLFRPLNNAGEQELLRKELDLPAGKKIMLFAGYFCREKRADLILQAWMKIREDWKGKGLILFIGSRNPGTWGVDIRLIEWFDRQIKLHNMESELRFVEKTHCMEKYYRACDIFLFASEREGLPNVLLEAMASALPCVSTKLNGVTDTLIADGKDGLLVNQDDPAAMAGALENLLRDRGLADTLGRNAGEKMKNDYDIHKISKRYIELYERMLS